MHLHIWVPLGYPQVSLVLSGTVWYCLEVSSQHHGFHWYMLYGVASLHSDTALATPQVGVVVSGSVWQCMAVSGSVW